MFFKCHKCHEAQTPGSKLIVLAGNPNVGKSVVFGLLSNIYADVSNYPGTTVELFSSRYGEHTLVDAPGVYGLSSNSPEEVVAGDIIKKADIILDVINGVTLERDLFLTTQIIQMGKPTIIILNFMDEVEAAGLKIDAYTLSRLIRAPVVSMVATKGRGLEELKRSLATAISGPGGESEAKDCCPDLGAKVHMLAIPRQDKVEAPFSDPDFAEDPMVRHEEAERIAGAVVNESGQRRSIRDRIGRWTVNPISGILILGIVGLGIYEMIGVLVAQNLVKLTENFAMKGLWEPWIKSLFSNIMAAGNPMSQVMVGEFGILTMTITYLVGLLLPLVLAFYFTLALLEDCGYLPRLAALVDRLMNSIGLNGKAVIPIILGFGCITMATITTRILGTKRERSIATAILNLTIPCSAQLGVITGLLAAISGRYTLLYVSVIFACLVATGTILNRAIPGRSNPLIIELPPIRMPQASNVMRKTLRRSFHFLKEATPLFFSGALIVSILQMSGLLRLWQDALSPITSYWLQLPKESATVFIMGMVRRDFGAAGLHGMSLTPLQMVVALTTITLFVPCIAATMILFKERGEKEACFIWGGSWAAALLVGGLLSQLLI